MTEVSRASKCANYLLSLFYFVCRFAEAGPANSHTRVSIALSSLSLRLPGCGCGAATHTGDPTASAPSVRSLHKFILIALDLALVPAFCANSQVASSPVA